jgi:hypothetical protein
VADYLEAYATRFQLPVRTGVRVDRLSRDDGRFPAMHSRRLSVTGTRVWCHWLGPDEYKVVADLTNYAVEP